MGKIQNDGNGKKKDSNLINKKNILFAAAGVAIIVGIALGVGFSMATPQSSPPSAESASVVTSINKQNEITFGDFEFHMCGEETQDPMKVPGEPEHPAQLSRSAGGDKVTIPFCVTATGNNNKVIMVDKVMLRDPVSRQQEYVNLVSLQDGSAQANTTNGMSVFVDRPAILTNTMTKLESAPAGSIYHVGDKFNVTITANSDAELGVHIIGISMLEPDESGVSGLGSTVFVYVDIVE